MAPRRVAGRTVKPLCRRKLKRSAVKKRRVKHVKRKVAKHRSGSGAAGPSQATSPLEEQSPVGEPAAPVMPTAPSEPVSPAEQHPPAEGAPAEESPPAEEQPPVTEPPGPFRFFASTDFWNSRLSAQAPLDPSSTPIVAALDEEVAAEEAAKKAPTINVTAWSVPIYTVPANQPTARVKLVYTVSAPLQAAWAAVPLPENAKPATGSDAHLVVWQPSKDLMWEFWGLGKTKEGWQASWGGAMERVSNNVGVYGPEAWPSATVYWGASASSLPLAGGLITLEDLERGQINHAIAIAVPNVRATTYASRPGGPTAIQMKHPHSLRALTCGWTRTSTWPRCTCRISL